MSAMDELFLLGSFFAWASRALAEYSCRERERDRFWFQYSSGSLVEELSLMLVGAENLVKGCDS